MQDRSTTSDAPAEQETRGPERGVARDNLRGRMERLADGHPSSPDYRAAGDSGRDARHEAAEVAVDQDRPEPPDHRDEPERRGLGWEARGARDHPAPTENDIHAPPDERLHIIEGDGPGKPGGGHRHGTNKPGKTEFPASWSDEVILAVVEDVARRPDAVEWQSNGTWLATGDRDNVRVSAVVLPDGRIRTAWPHPGGAGVTQNPEAR